MMDKYRHSSTDKMNDLSCLNTYIHTSEMFLISKIINYMECSFDMKKILSYLENEKDFHINKKNFLSYIAFKITKNERYEITDIVKYCDKQGINLIFHMIHTT